MVELLRCPIQTLKIKITLKTIPTNQQMTLEGMLELKIRGNHEIEGAQEVQKVQQGSWERLGKSRSPYRQG